MHTDLITILGTLITDFVVEPRLKAFGGELTADDEDDSLATVTDAEKRGLKAAGISALIPADSFFRGAEGEILGNTPLFYPAV